MLLQNLQADFVDLLTNAENSTELLVHPVANMLIYRNNHRVHMRAALFNAYPLLVKLLGEEFFAATADEYIEQFPSRRADLNNYGEYFGDFLAYYAPARQLVYLPEVAAFEWACHQVFFAADHPPLAIATLQNITPARYPSLRSTLHPASKLMQFQYPILQLIDLCKNRIEEITDIESGGIDLLIIRRELDVKLSPLTPGEYAFLSTVQDEQPLSSAVAAALMVDPYFNLNDKLPRWVQDKTIVRME